MNTTTASTAEEQRLLAQRLLVDEFVDALATGPRTLVSTPGYGSVEQMPLVYVVHRLIDVDGEDELLTRLLRVLEGHLDIEPLAEQSLMLLARLYAGTQVQLMSDMGYFSE